MNLYLNKGAHHLLLSFSNGGVYKKTSRKVLDSNPFILLIENAYQNYTF